MTSNKSFNLTAKLRTELGKEVENLRVVGQLPAVLYGKNIENKNLTVRYSDFEKLSHVATESDLIDLNVDRAGSVKVLIHQVDFEPVTHKMIHVDFYQVNMKEKIRTELELKFIGEAPAVKDLGGVLVKTMDHIEIECLPSDLISQTEVNLDNLKEIGDVIRVKDLAIPKNIEVLTDPEATLVLVEEPKKIEEEIPVVPTEGETEGEAAERTEGEGQETGDETETKSETTESEKKAE